MKNVNRLKLTYQKNMLTGQIIVILLVTIFCVIVMERPSGKSIVKGTLFTDYYINDDNQIEASKRAAKKNLGKWPASMRDGFLGFDVKFRIAEKLTSGERDPDIPAIILPDQPYVDPDIVSYSEYEGNMDGLLLSNDLDYIYRATQPSSKINREITVLYRSDPIYPRIALDAKVEGIVVILVYVDSLGYMSPFSYESNDGSFEVMRYLIIKEEPADWFFASSLINELPKWIFSPRIENCQNVGSFLTVSFKYQIRNGSSQAAMSGRQD